MVVAAPSFEYLEVGLVHFTDLIDEAKELDRKVEPDASYQYDSGDGDWN